MRVEKSPFRIAAKRLEFDENFNIEHLFHKTSSGSDVTPWTIVQLSPKPQMSERRSRAQYVRSSRGLITIVVMVLLGTYLSIIKNSYGVSFSSVVREISALVTGYLTGLNETHSHSTWKWFHIMFSMLLMVIGSVSNHAQVIRLHIGLTYSMHFLTVFIYILQRPELGLYVMKSYPARLQKISI